MQTKAWKPRWLTAMAVASATATLAPASSASADPGAVQLRNGGRMNGNITLVLPNDRVQIVLPDGTSTVVPWSDILFVFDGSRVYDSAGNMGSVPSATELAPVTGAASANRAGTQTTSGGWAPVDAGAPATTTPSTQGARWGRFRAPPGASAEQRYLALPRRGATVALWTVGAMFSISGGATLGAALSGGCSEDGYGYYGYYGPTSSCRGRRIAIGTGTATLGLGALMMGFGLRRTRIRRAGLESLRAEGLQVADVAPAVEFTVVADQQRFVPQLRLRF